MRRLLLDAGALFVGALDLDERASHYLFRVLRLSVGDPLEVGDGSGRYAQATVTALSKGRVTLAVDAIQRAASPPGPAITVLQGVGKGDKMDTVVRQCTELGARRIVPVVTARTVATRRHRVDRWRTIAEDALRVSGRWHRPTIDPVTPLEAALAAASAEEGVRWVLALDAATSLADASESLRAAASSSAETSGAHASLTILIGPEGGLTAAEVTGAASAGFAPVGLGPHTLRTETAGPAVVAIAMFVGGGLGAR